MAQVEVGNVKTAQEMFRLLEGAVQRGEVHGVHSQQSMEAMIQSVLRQLDHMRPVGPDGKHGMLHTGNCGCFLEPEEPKMVTCPYCGGRGEHVQSAGDGTEYMQFCVRCHGTGQVNDQGLSERESTKPAGALRISIEISDPTTRKIRTIKLSKASTELLRINDEDASVEIHGVLIQNTERYVPE